MRFKSAVNVGKTRTSCSEEFLATQTKSSLAPTSIPAHFGLRRLNGAGIVLADFVFFFTASLLILFLAMKKDKGLPFFFKDPTGVTERSEGTKGGSSPSEAKSE